MCWESHHDVFDAIALGSESGDVKRTGWGICLGDETLDLNQPEHLELVCELLLGIADDLAQRQPE